MGSPRDYRSKGLLVACGGEDNNATTSDTSTMDLAAVGQEVVNKSCVGCYGTDLQGATGPSLKGLDLTKEEIYDIVKNGKGQECLVD
jgi:mono/diheme cytochrome c family protein